MADTRTSCGGILVRETDGFVLLIQYYDGHWSFPKGRMEPGETEEAAALREIAEETGLTAALRPGFRAETVSVKRSVGAKTVFFLAAPLSGREQVQKSELAALRWTSPEEAEAAVTYETDRQVLRDALASWTAARKNRRHLLLCGDVGVGKSTLIGRLLAESRRPLYGFATRRVPVPDDDGLCSVYLHPAAQPLEARTYGEENRVGRCDRRHALRYPKIFDEVGVPLLQAPENGLILMDELGFLENDAAAFRRAVLAALDGSVPVLAAVKSRDTAFLREVKCHPGAELVFVNVQNRDDLYRRLLPRIQAWNHLA